MRTIQKLFLVASLSLLMPVIASAQSASDVRAMSPEDRRTYMQSMSDEERTAMRQKWRSEFAALPEEERQAIRQQRAETRDGRDRDAMRERWDSMSDDERAAAKDRRRQRSDERRARWDSMSDEERAAARARRDDHRGEHGGNRSGKGQRSQRGQGEVPES